MNRLSKTFSAELEGIEARAIEIEVDLHVGLHAITIVGLADKALNEARERINSAIKNSGAKPPNRENRRITINLAPADIKKTGSHYDLAIAVGYLLATGQIKKHDDAPSMFLGELALDGALRPIPGTINIAEMCKRNGYKKLFLPAENANEAAVIPDIEVIPLKSLSQAIMHLEGKELVRPKQYSFTEKEKADMPDLSDIKGLENAKRALSIAAAGGHNLLLVGPPGVGKSMLAHAMIGILPKLSLDESISVTKIWSAAGLFPGSLIYKRPFRAPHQTSSLVSIIGGGSDPKPGEISLAHHGVLFLDELPEFPRNTLEALRAPLESGVVRISRSKKSLSFPAKFSLIAAMNPCPCGFYGHPEKECKCGANEIARYQKKISGPLLDRIDLQVRVAPLPLEALRKNGPVGKGSNEILQDIYSAKESQSNRFKNEVGMSSKTNSAMKPSQIERLAGLQPGAERFLQALKSSYMSPRGYYRLIKTARTIADLEKCENIDEGHVSEAYGYRLKTTDI